MQGSTAASPFEEFQQCAACSPFEGVDEGVGWGHGGVVGVGVVAGGGGQHGQQAKVAVAHRRQQRTTPGDTEKKHRRAERRVREERWREVAL